MIISHSGDAAAVVPAFSLGPVTLVVNDLKKVCDFYQKTIGLHLLSGDGATAVLGAGHVPLLVLRRDQAARQRSQREAGLFHTAFLMPTRADLGRFIQHAIAIRAPVVGASDHLVSEAVYLADPEGNGIEVYSDRPRSTWTWKNGLVEMSTDPLDIDSLIASAAGDVWKGFPEGSTIGHVHLQVGAIAPAEQFYAGMLGLAITSRYPGGTFYAADGYHHHVATNIWNSRGAGERSFPSTGLADVAIHVTPETLGPIQAREPDASLTAGTRLSLRDPWGTPITVTAG